MTDRRHIVTSSVVIRQAMRLNDLELGLVCSHLNVPYEDLYFYWCEGFMEAMEGLDLETVIKEAKSTPPASWEKVAEVVKLGAEGRECLRMLRSSS